MVITTGDKKLRAIIVDDELHGRENLKQIIELYCPEIEICGLADSVLQANELVIVKNPDVVFLDINMPILDGFDFLAGYEKRNFMVIFVSAYEEFGIKAIKAGAVDYLLKPISIKELKQSVKKLISLKDKSVIQPIDEENDKLIIPSSQGFEVINIGKIVRLEAEGSYTIIVIMGEKNKIISRTLKDFEETLPQAIFIRTHKSHIINIKYIKDYSKLNGYHVNMIDGSKVEISRRKATEFLQKVKAYLKSI